MDNIEPPSFSLGFDIDTESELRLPSQRNPSSPVASCDRVIGDGDDELGLTISDSDPEPEPKYSSRVLKELRRGTSAEQSSKNSNVALVEEVLGRSDDLDDDVEEFSSPDDFLAEVPASTRSRFSCSSSKVPLLVPGVLNRVSSLREKGKQLDVPMSNGSGISSAASLFQRSTCSPLRKFQLLDSDSEEDRPSTSKGVSRVTGSNGSSSKGLQSVRSKPKENESGSMSCTGDLWRDFSPQAFQIHTPALDDVCRDYFRSMKENCTPQNCSNAAANSKTGEHFNSSGQQAEQCWDFAHPSPPSHRFFLHSDPRIRDLARKRLPNFSPLGIVDGNGSRQSLFLIDYMNQFGTRGNSKTANTRNKIHSSGQTKSKVSKSQEGLHASEGWLNPKTSSAAPKDAGKRRVSANSGSAGHWYTSPEGRKVYVSRTGQELSGQSAYRCFKKESGGGSRKSKRKGQTKKQTRKKPKH
ncbi:PREDICTED: uncharacterized protein LOC104817868 isoform X2 [Tarenaya hassleriana]|uniref:uncharacterized protein LOC104817868 isoform X2 n=1 Tax=Tarenaya hassleriana TaxID=28532 RepID=UPI00053CA36B|nr:PREDICTED: uncharacterized protein LOC104817868 isoform X2 [Tarenaya hassleriana]XP_010545531.1 PREDICTED: uncharacterized protein LOC104817868 isoform X2 [Tarenaya hassleriana]